MFPVRRLSAWMFKPPFIKFYSRQFFVYYCNKLYGDWRFWVEKLLKLYFRNVTNVISEKNVIRFCVFLSLKMEVEQTLTNKIAIKEFEHYCIGHCTTYNQKYSCWFVQITIYYIQDVQWKQTSVRISKTAKHLLQSLSLKTENYKTNTYKLILTEII